MMDLVNRGIWLCRHPEYLTCEETPEQDDDIETIIKYGVQSVSEYCSFYGKNYVVSDHIKSYFRDIATNYDRIVQEIPELKRDTALSFIQRYRPNTKVAEHRTLPKEVFDVCSKHGIKYVSDLDWMEINIPYEDVVLLRAYFDVQVSDLYEHENAAYIPQCSLYDVEKLNAVYLGYRYLLGYQRNPKSPYCMVSGRCEQVFEIAFKDDSYLDEFKILEMRYGRMIFSQSEQLLSGKTDCAHYCNNIEDALVDVIRSDTDHEGYRACISVKVLRNTNIVDLIEANYRSAAKSVGKFIASRAKHLRSGHAYKVTNMSIKGNILTVYAEMMN